MAINLLDSRAVMPALTAVLGLDRHAVESISLHFCCGKAVQVEAKFRPAHEAGSEAVQAIVVSLGGKPEPQ